MKLLSLKISHILILGGLVGLLWAGIMALLEPEQARIQAQNDERREMIHVLLNALIEDRVMVGGF